MAERRTIRPTEDVYEQLNADRKEKSLSWDEYLTRLQEGEAIEVRIADEQANEIARNAGKEAADELEGRLR